MEKKINNILFFTGKDGSQMVFRVLFTFYSEVFKKDYAVFYNEQDENNLIAYSFPLMIPIPSAQSKQTKNMPSSKNPSKGTTRSRQILKLRNSYKNKKNGPCVRSFMLYSR